MVWVFRKEEKMIGLSLIGGVIGFLIGIVYERYRWVNRSKKDKAIEVDGQLYKVKKAKAEIDE